MVFWSSWLKGEFGGVGSVAEAVVSMADLGETRLRRGVRVADFLMVDPTDVGTGEKMEVVNDGTKAEAFIFERCSCGVMSSQTLTS